MPRKKTTTASTSNGPQRHRQPTNLTLSKTTRALLEAWAKERGWSVSRVVDDLVERHAQRTG